MRSQGPPRPTTPKPATTPHELSRLLKTSGRKAAGHRVIGGVHQHDDQHAAFRIVEHPVEDDHCGKNQHDIWVADLPNQDERQMPAGDENAEDQAGNECRPAMLQPRNCVTPPAGLLHVPPTPGMEDDCNFGMSSSPGVGGAWEEPGWRGYAVPRLQHGRSALVASLILGVLIAGWHLPLILVGQVRYPDIVLILAAVIVFNWVFNNAKGSVLIIMLMHAANNAVSGSFFSPMFSGADSVREAWLLALVWWVVAVLVIAISGPANFSRKYHKQEEPP